MTRSWYRRYTGIQEKKTEAKASYESAKNYYNKTITDYDSACKAVESIRKTMTELDSKAAN